MKTPEKQKNEYYAILNTSGSLDSCFRPRLIGMETVNDPKRYRFDGAFRDFDKPHTIFQYTIRGTGRIRWRQTDYDIPPKHAFFCNSHDPEIVYYYPPESRQDWQLLFATFDNMSEVADEMIRRFGPVYTIDEHAECIQEITRYLYGSDGFVEFKPSHSFRLAGMVISALLDSVFEGNQTPSHSRIVNGAIEYIAGHLNESMNVERVAAHLDISREHLARIFSQEMGTAPSQFINITKIRQAGNLLRTTNLNIHEIAAAVGYENTSHFSRLFRRITGMSPSEFRSAKGRPIF